VHPGCGVLTGEGFRWGLRFVLAELFMLTDYSENYEHTW
jgi:hypothetical protein